MIHPRQPKPSVRANPRIVVYADGSICIFDGLGTLKHKQPALPAGPVLCIASGRGTWETGRQKQSTDLLQGATRTCVYMYIIYIYIYIYIHA